MFFTYQNRESSLYLKNNTKVKNNVVVAKFVPPPPISNVLVVNQTNYKTRVKQPQRNPLRQYRRQLTVENSEKTVSKLIINQFNQPGKVIVVNNREDCYTCDPSDNQTLFFKEEIYPNNILIDCSGTECLGYQAIDPMLWKYTCCNPQTNVIKSASTNISKSYSTSNRDFLKKKCKTYSQNLYSNTANKCSVDCSYNCPVSNVTSTGNINNAIGGNMGSAYIYQMGYRNIDNAQIDSSNNSICCNPKNILYKPINQTNYTCINQLYPNLAQSKNICSK